MRKMLFVLGLLICLTTAATADPFVFNFTSTSGGQSGGRFDNTSALARDPYLTRITIGQTTSTATVLTLNPTTLDINSPVGSITYSWRANPSAYFNLDAGQSSVLTLSEITRTITGTPAAATYNVSFYFTPPALSLTLGPPSGNPANWITGQLINFNPIGRQTWGGNVSATGITSGGLYADPGDNLNPLLGTLSYAFPNQTISLTLNPAQWVNNTLTITATVTSTPAAPVPEPMTLLLLGSGLAGIAALRRGKRT